MPTQTLTKVQGYAGCVDPLCPGYEQEHVEVDKEVVEFYYREMGGDLPGVERSVVRALDQSVDPCGHCGKARIASLEPRPEYPPISGQHPLALLDLNNEKLVRQNQVANLEQAAQLAEMRAQMAELKAELASRPRGPGRPRKVEDE